MEHEVWASCRGTTNFVVPEVVLTWMSGNGLRNMPSTRETKAAREVAEVRLEVDDDLIEEEDDEETRRLTTT